MLASINYPCEGYDNCFCRKCLVCWVERARNLPHSINDCTTRRERFSERYIDANYDWKYHAPDGTTHLYIPRTIREQINQSYQRHVERSQSRSSVSAPYSHSSNQRDNVKRQRSSQRSSTSMQPQRTGQPFQPRDRVPPKPICPPPSEPSVPPVVNIIAHTCRLCDLNERRRCLLGDTKLPVSLISVYMESPHFSNPSLHLELLQARRKREQYRLRYPKAKEGPPYFVLSHILPGQPEELLASSMCKRYPSRVSSGPAQGSRVLIAPGQDRSRNCFFKLPARTKLLGRILAFSCTTDAELMRLRTVSMQFYYLTFEMPYGLNALRGLTDLLAGLSLEPQSAMQQQRGTGDAELFKVFVPKTFLPAMTRDRLRHREDNFFSEQQAISATSRLRRVLCNISGGQMNAINKEIIITQDHVEIMGSYIADKLLRTPKLKYPDMNFTWQDRLFIRPGELEENPDWNVANASTRQLWRPKSADSGVALVLHSTFPKNSKIEPINTLLEPHYRALGGGLRDAILKGAALLLNLPWKACSK